MLASSQTKRSGSRMRPYFMISLMPLASSRSGSVFSVSTSISTAAQLQTNYDYLIDLHCGIDMRMRSINWSLEALGAAVQVVRSQCNRVI